MQVLPYEILYLKQGGICTLPYKLTTTIKNINSIPNQVNVSLVSEFHQYMISNCSSERHQNNNLKTIVCFARFLGPTISFLDICKKEQVLPFLDTKIKNSEEDAEKETLKAFSMDGAAKIIEKLA
jgi:integrase/recombinase XerD